MDDIGILLRGKSLEHIALIHDKFKDCYIVNGCGEEIDMFEQYIKGKNIAHFVNSGTRSALFNRRQYEKYNINQVHFSFTKGMITIARTIKLRDLYATYGVTELNHMPEKYRKRVESIRNTGVCCIFYVSEVIKPKRIWISGLDFYREDYLVKENSPHHLPKSKKIDLTGSFVKIVKNHPNIEYNLVTYYKELPKINNLTILEV